MGKEKKSGYAELLEEYSIEGLEILQGTSSVIAHALIYIVFAMIAAFAIWSFFAKADVVVTTRGQLVEKNETKRIYVPAAGELIEMYVTEGVPVEKGDLLARIRSQQAIQIASAAAQAKLALENATFMKEQFPATKTLLEKEIKGREHGIQLLRQSYERLKKDGLRQLTDTQKRRLEILRVQLAEKKAAQDQAREIYLKYARLYKTDAHGGISKKEMLEKELEKTRAEAEYRQVSSQLEDLELTFSQQYLANKQKIEQIHMQLIQAQLEIDKKKQELAKLSRDVEAKYLSALEAWRAASKVNFSDLDENNFLVIRAPVAGEVSKVWFRQSGEKIRPSAPLLAISARNSGKAVLLSILDKDRALLKIGQTAKLKFHAFPYQRFGFLKGKLTYLSNNAELTKNGLSLYRGKVDLEKDYFVLNGNKLPVRFGMKADVEIVVQRRRVIDFALDPFRKLVH